MSVSPFGFFFYRPFRYASNVCADQVVIPLLKRIESLGRDLFDRASKARESAKDYENSLIGRIAKSIVCETAGAMAGAAVGEMVVGKLCAAGGYQAFPVLCVIGLAASVARQKKTEIALFSVGFVAPAFFSRKMQAEYFVQLGQYAGRTAGTILGGYAGLKKLAGADIELVNRTRPSDSYLVNMLKFQAAGEAFDAVFNSSSIPCVSLVINLPRNAAKSVFQAMGYNSKVAVPLLKKCLREKRIAITIPVAIKMVCSRYCVEQSKSLSLQTTQLISDTVMPSVLKSVGRLITCNALAVPLQTGIDYLGTHSDQLATILMRGFHQYCAIVKKIHSDSALIANEQDDLVAIGFEADEKANGSAAYLGISPVQLKAALKEQIPGASFVSPLFDQAMKANVSDWANSLVEIIRSTEKATFGTEIVDEEQVKYLKEFLPIYLKYYVIFILLNGPKLNHELTLIEEREFFSDVNGAFFSIYARSPKVKRIAQGIEKTTSFAVGKLYEWRRYFEPTDEETLVDATFQIAEDCFPAIPLPKEPEPQVVFTTAEDACSLVQALSEEASPAVQQTQAASGASESAFSLANVLVTNHFSSDRS